MVSSSDHAVADEKATVMDESSATLERRVSMACYGAENMSVWTRGVLGGEGVVTSLVGTGMCMVPKTPLWSKLEVERVVVSPICVESCHGSQMGR